ncbi:MT-A70-domain-containing protein [Syncephalastrum racemosum]|uniref:MT-A70-domain-containing protein n=1 Tax=Syncephalastrum racemosum TaxID=13706 RepID=A0A1X2H756_SYNRA|nr:MT-A70-domain-containing protein [Syncephalastrum racemosum]
MIVASSDTCDIVDCEAAFGIDGTVRLRPGDFSLGTPYFTSRLGQKRPRPDDDTLDNTPSDTIHAIVQQLPVMAPDYWHDRPMEAVVMNAHVHFPSLVSLAEASLRFDPDNDEDEDNRQILRPDMALESLQVFYRHFEHPKDSPILIRVQDAYYWIPPRTAFMMGSLENIHLPTLGKFDCIVMDPPWPNKSVRRSAHYETQEDIYDLFAIPLPQLAQPNCLVAVWVTNKPKFIRFVQKLFAAWDVEPLTTWYWLKVTTHGEPVCPIDSPHRKPYEHLILGRKRPVKININDPPALPRVLVSVPSKHHSRKPPLNDILMRYLPSDARRLELFARCLTPGWTSWGNECLKFQHVDYFYDTNEAMEEGKQK